jgi:hypothetical protein
VPKQREKQAKRTHKHAKTKKKQPKEHETQAKVTQKATPTQRATPQKQAHKRHAPK